MAQPHSNHNLGVQLLIPTCCKKTFRYTDSKIWFAELFIAGWKVPTSATDGHFKSHTVLRGFSLQVQDPGSVFFCFSLRRLLDEWTVRPTILCSPSISALLNCMTSCSTAAHVVTVFTKRARLCLL